MSTVLTVTKGIPLTFRIVLAEAISRGLVAKVKPVHLMAVASAWVATGEGISGVAERSGSAKLAAIARRVILTRIADADGLEHGEQSGHERI